MPTQRASFSEFLPTLWAQMQRLTFNRKFNIPSRKTSSQFITKIGDSLADKVTDFFKCAFIGKISLTNLDIPPKILRSKWVEILYFLHGLPNFREKVLALNLSLTFLLFEHFRVLLWLDWLKSHFLGSAFLFASDFAGNGIDQFHDLLGLRDSALRRSSWEIAAAITGTWLSTGNFHVFH